MKKIVVAFVSIALAMTMLAPTASARGRSDATCTTYKVKSPWTGKVVNRTYCSLPFTGSFPVDHPIKRSNWR